MKSTKLVGTDRLIPMTVFIASKTFGWENRLIERWSTQLAQLITLHNIICLRFSMSNT